MNILKSLGTPLVASREADIKQATRDYLQAQNNNPSTGRTYDGLAKTSDSYMTLPPRLCSHLSEECPPSGEIPQKVRLDYIKDPDSPGPTMEAPFEVVLHPAFDFRRSQAKGYSCNTPTPDDIASWQQTTRDLNAQFADYKLPVRFKFETNTNQLGSSNATASSSSIPVMRCAKLDEGDLDIVSGEYDPHYGEIRVVDNLARVRVHELGHAIGLQHPHAVTPIPSMQREFAELTCEGGTEGPGAMQYPTECAKAGLVFGIGADLTQGRISAIDLCGVEMTTTNRTAHEDVLTRCSNRVYELVASTAGARVAAFFVASAASKVVERALIQAVLRNTPPGTKRRAAMLACSAIARTIQVAIIAQSLSAGLPTNAVLIGAAGMGSHALFQSGVLGKMLRAISRSIGDANLVATMVAAIRGSAWSAAAMASSIGGNAAGNIVAASLDAVLEHRVNPLDEDARKDLEAYFDPGFEYKAFLFRPSNEQQDPNPVAIDIPDGDVQPDAEDEDGGIGCDRAIKRLIAFDASLGGFIDKYLNLNCLRSWVYAADQKKHDDEIDMVAGLSQAMQGADEPDESNDDESGQASTGGDYGGNDSGNAGVQSNAKAKANTPTTSDEQDSSQRENSRRILFGPPLAEAYDITPDASC
jgi:hypothetical protein